MTTARWELDITDRDFKFWPCGVHRGMTMGNSIVIRGDEAVPAGGEGKPDIIESRGERVVLDADLASLFGVETRVLNQAFKRNQQRFPGNWAWQLTEPEFENLKSQIVMSSGVHGGRRTPPWAFSEHGVIMVATILNSERAILASQRVIEAFVDVRRGAQPTGKELAKAGKSTKMGKLRADLMPQLREHLQALMSFEINAKDGKTAAIPGGSDEDIKGRRGRTAGEQAGHGAKAAEEDGQRGDASQSAAPGSGSKGATR